MKYYYRREDRIIDSEEMRAKYGTEKALPALGIYELTVQPDYVPFGFNALEDGTYYPVESYTSKVKQAKDALMTAGLTESEAEAALS